MTGPTIEYRGGHSFSKKLHCVGGFFYCCKCGLIGLSNKASIKESRRPCKGKRDLDDDEYLKQKGK
jgi:hypothetical protein